MNIAKRLVILFVLLVFIAYIVLTYLVRDAVPKQAAFADFGTNAEVLYLYKTKNFYMDRTVIDRYFTVNRGKALVEA